MSFPSPSRWTKAAHSGTKRGMQRIAVVMTVLVASSCDAERRISPGGAGGASQSERRDSGPAQDGPASGQDASVDLPEIGPRDAGTADQDAARQRDASPPADSGPAAGDPFNPATIVTRYAEAVCDRSSRCEPFRAAYYRQTQQRCVQLFVAQWAAIYGAYGEANALGRVRFDRAAFEMCVSEFSTLDCHASFSSACERFLIGGRQRNESCAIQIECAADLWCRGPGACGTCVPASAVWQSCTPGSCMRGYDCQTQTGGRQICVPAGIGEGGACGTGTAECTESLQCVGGRCTRPAGPGQVCDGSGVRLPRCDQGMMYACMQGTCTAFTLAPRGGACGGTVSCDAEGLCDSSSRQCAPLPADGQACSNQLCAPDHFCDGAFCRRDKARGGTCSALGARECEVGLGCRGSPLACMPFEYSACP